VNHPFFLLAPRQVAHPGAIALRTWKSMLSAYGHSNVWKHMLVGGFNHLEKY
jgi:hypothetical protein